MKSSVISGRSANVDAYIDTAPGFAQPILTHVRELVHQASPEIAESIKWSRPFFLHRGVILGNMSAFTVHCSFGFWGAEMGAVLRADGIERSESSGSFGRLTSVKDLPKDKVLLGYLRRAIVLAEGATANGPKGSSSRATRLSPRERAKKGEALAPRDLVAALEAKPVAKANFAKLSPSCRREYIEWINEAKRTETRERRVATTVEQVGDGKGRHWKYA